MTPEEKDVYLELLQMENECHKRGIPVPKQVREESAVYKKKFFEYRESLRRDYEEREEKRKRTYDWRPPVKGRKRR
jgi:hypothetical protein